MMKQAIAVSLFYNSTLLIKSPDPYMDIIVGGTDGRKKLGDRRFSFKARGVTPNVTVGDYFVVSTSSVFDLPSRSDCTCSYGANPTV